MNISFAAFTTSAVAILTTVGFKLIGALIIWFVGRKLIVFAQRLIAKAMNRQHLDAMVIGYLRTSLGAVLNIALVVALLGFFGVETTTFAALLAGVGLAIGAAWGGLLSNFAAGIFMVVLRPFKVGDFVTAAGVTGTVHAVGIFGTIIDTPDNVSTTIGNAKIFADTVQNFTTNSYRRVDLTAQLDHSVNPLEAIALLKVKLAAIPNVMTSPAPDAEILQFTAAGPLLAVRPYCHNENYWQVYFDTNRVIYETFSGAGYAVPQQHVAVRGMAAGAGGGS